MTLLWFGGSGMVTSDVLQLFFMGLPAALLGTWLGLKLYGTLDEVRFRRIILLLLLTSGLTLLPAAFRAKLGCRSQFLSLPPVSHRQSQATQADANRCQTLKSARTHQDLDCTRSGLSFRGAPGELPAVPLSQRLREAQVLGATWSASTSLARRASRAASRILPSPDRSNVRMN